MADEKIHKLQIDVSKVNDEKEAAERRNKSLHKQVGDLFVPEFKFFERFG